MEQLSRSNNRHDYYLRLAIAGAGIVCFIFISWQMVTGGINGFDDAIRYFAYGTRGPVLNKIFIPITYLGNWEAITSVIVILILIPKTRVKIGIPVGVSELISLVIYKSFKILFARPRPDVALHLITQGGYSYPSGHSMNGLVCYGMLIFLVRRYCKNGRTANILTVLLTLLIIAIGWSRIFVGVHYPSDIIGGWTLGMAVLMFETIAVDEIVWRYNERH